jgi:hypothetical protein
MIHTREEEYNPSIHPSIHSQSTHFQQKVGDRRFDCGITSDKDPIDSCLLYMERWFLAYCVIA